MNVEGKLAFIVESLLPYIHDALARALLNEQLLSFAALKPAVLADLLTDASIVTAPGSTDPLIAPLRAVEHEGWFAEFFPTTTLVGPFARACAAIGCSRAG